MFIEIQKIVTQYAKDKEGKVILDPGTKRKRIGGMKVVKETIRLDEIKSSRGYHDPKLYRQNNIEGDVTVLYMKGRNAHDTKLPEIHINESIASFNERIGATKVSE